MWKILTEKGEQLPDLLVVLAITVVLAAILLPAVTSTHGNEVSADTSVQMDHVVVDGHVRPNSRQESDRRHRLESARVAEERMDSVDALSTDAVALSEADFRPAIADMRTTDISYTIP